MRTWGLCFGPAWETSLAELMEPAAAAEAAGFDRIATGEFRNDSLAWLAAFAAATKRVPVVTTIASIALRHPSVTGEAFAALRDLHGDRIELGLGVSHPSIVSGDLGLIQPRLADLEEYVEAVRSVVRGSEFEGERYSVPAHGRVRVLEAPGSILVSALGEVAARRAATYADGVILTWSPTSWTRRITSAVREVDAHTGRRTPVWVVLPTFPGPVDRGREACARHLRPYLRQPSYRQMLACATAGSERIDRATADDVDDRERSEILGSLVDDVAAIGDRDQVTAAITAIETAGADTVILYPLDTGDGWREAVDSTITRLAPAP